MNLRNILEHVIRFLDNRDVLHGSSSPLMIITLNSEMIGLMDDDFEFKKALGSASLIVPDGIGIVIASRLLGASLGSRICGIDLGERLCELAVEKGYSVYLLGGRERVVDKAKTNLCSRFPGLEIVGAHHGYFDATEERIIVEDIQRVRPHILLVGLGAPKQEKWIMRHLDILPPCVCMGIGGSFDVWSGDVARAPAWVRRIGMEWLYRILRQPSRIRRTVYLLKFTGLVVVQVVRRLLGR
jgi:N-acetylglucosaminyldiphosphoundecaprenol N-acetyl-beta-D-mannosaminyltransferase